MCFCLANPSKRGCTDWRTIQHPPKLRNTFHIWVCPIGLTGQRKRSSKARNMGYRERQNAMPSARIIALARCRPGNADLGESMEPRSGAHQDGT